MEGWRGYVSGVLKARSKSMPPASHCRELCALASRRVSLVHQHLRHQHSRPPLPLSGQEMTRENDWLVSKADSFAASDRETRDIAKTIMDGLPNVIINTRPSLR